MPKNKDPRLSDPVNNVNDAIQDRIIRHMVYLERLKNQEVRQVLKVLNRDIIPDMTTKVQRQVEKFERRGGATERRLIALEKSLRKLADDMAKKLQGELADDFIELSRDEVQWLVGMIREELKVEVVFDIPSPKAVVAAITATPFAGYKMDQWFGTLSNSLRRKLTVAIQRGLVEGETTPQIMRRIRGTKALNYTDGVFQATRREAEAVTRSAVNHISNQARLELFKQNEDILKGLKYTATLDSRTSTLCAGLDGKIYPLDKGPRPPMHVNCRSTMTPVIKSAKQLGLKDIPEGTRASINGQVPGSTTYGQWLKRQPIAVQEQVLGKTKAKLFREGNVPIEKFTSNNLEPLTIDELRKTEKSSFKAAGIEV